MYVPDWMAQREQRLPRRAVAAQLNDPRAQGGIDQQGDGVPEIDVGEIGPRRDRRIPIVRLRSRRITRW